MVDGVDLCCGTGQVLGLLGANGAGKTTTLRLCAGFLQPDAGTIHVAGIDRRADPEAAARPVGVCTQDDTFDRDFTVRGNKDFIHHAGRIRMSHLMPAAGGLRYFSCHLGWLPMYGRDVLQGEVQPRVWELFTGIAEQYSKTTLPWRSAHFDRRRVVHHP